ncbi:hypothetical protein ACQ4PT_071297 [Festuca glaucescens]
MADKQLAGSSGTAAGGDGEIDDMLRHLELNDDELDDVVIGAEKAKVYQDAARWLAIGKGPWIFRGFGLLVEDYDGLSAPEKFVFNGMYVWAQIHGIPELYRKLDIVDDLARKIGMVKEVQLAPKLLFEGNYVRVRVRINIEKALMRFVSLTIPEGKKRLMVKYEKLPFFCKRCGLLGHDHEECGDGVWEEKQLQWGSWMLATRRANQPNPGPRRFTPNAPSRGGFSGRGGATTGFARKRSSEEASLDDTADLTDTGSSPMKTMPSDLETEEQSVGKEATTCISRKLDMNSVEITMEDRTKESGTRNTDTLQSETAPPPPPVYVDPRDRVKLRKTGELTNNLATSAASVEEDRRAQ